VAWEQMADGASWDTRAGDFTITWEAFGGIEQPRFLAQMFSASGVKVGEEALVRYEDQD
jgi:hypothetical protein